MHRKARYGAALLAGSVALLAAACGSSGGGSGSTASKVDTTPVRVAFSDTPDVGDITVLAAMKMMRQQGYNITSQIMNGNAVNATAVASGSAQIGNLSAATLFQSINHAEPFTMLAQTDDNEFAIVTPSSITKVKQLNGQLYGLAGPNTSTAALSDYTQKTNHVTFKVVYVASSSARATALLSGQIVATPLGLLDDVAKILNGSPGKFHILVDYSKSVPWLLNNVLYTTKSFKAKHKALLQTLINDMATTVKQAYANPVSFIHKYANLLSGYTMDVLVTTMKQSSASKIWGNNDEITATAASQTLAFDESGGALTAAQVAQLKSTENGWFTPITPSS